MAVKSHILIVEARFYPDIADELVRGAVAALEDAGATYERVTVPGAFEVPVAIRMAIERGRHDGYIALGCVIRGETPHFDYICAESARGLGDLAIRYMVAIGYGILTCENRDQAWVRAAVDKRNKGRDAAVACLAMIRLKQDFGLGPQ